MTTAEIVEAINSDLPTNWEPFDDTGDGDHVQGYLKSGKYGCVGRDGCFWIVFAADGVPVSGERVYADWNDAMVSAEAYSEQEM